MRYWHHPESSCVFITEDHEEAGIECVELEHDEFLKWKEYYKQQPCRWCDDTGYFYSQADLGYCNCEAGTLKIHEDHKDLLG